jgi:stage V sporulation protein R
MKTIVMIVRNTALYFAPQIRTKIINEGWASYWHDKLFIADERISGHESDYAHVNAGVTSLNRIGLNPYAIGLRLIQHVEELSDKGKLNFGFSLIKDIEQRNAYDKNTGNGMKAIFNLRSIFSDHMLINTFVDQDFVDKHNLFVTGKRFNPQRETVEYYIQSRKAEDYRDMLLQSLYHPPYIKVDTDESGSGLLYLNHVFEGKQLYKPYIADTLMAAEFLWGAKVQFETTNIIVSKDNKGKTYQRVLYTMENKKMSVINL